MQSTRKVTQWSEQKENREVNISRWYYRHRATGDVKVSSKNPTGSGRGRDSPFVIKIKQNSVPVQKRRSKKGDIRTKMNWISVKKQKRSR